MADDPGETLRRINIYNDIEKDNRVREQQQQQLLGCRDDMPVSDIVHLKYPVSVDSVVHCLDTRFIRGLNETWLGPSLLLLNPYTNVTNCGPEFGPEDISSSRLLSHKVTEVLQELFHTKLPQTFVLRGESGSGKSYNARRILSSVFSQTNHGFSRSSCYSKVSAALTVIRSLTNVATGSNSDSSRVALFLQNYIKDFTIYKTKISCVYIDHGRVTMVTEGFNNYHIFYEMLTGLSLEEKRTLYLDSYLTSKDFHFLSRSDPPADSDTLDRHFQHWKACLQACAVSFSDVTRVLAAVLLIGNITFIYSTSQQLALLSDYELKCVAVLLGVPAVVLYRGLTTKTLHTPDGTTVTPLLSVTKVHENRDVLAQALYIRTVHMVVRKANSLLRSLANKKGRDPSNASGSCQSDDRLSVHRSFLSAASSEKSIPPSTDHRQPPPLLNILDMFGFENLTENRLEQLAINFCSELLKNFQDSHTINASKTSNNSDNNSHPQSQPETLQHSSTEDQSVVDLISNPANGILQLLNEAVRDTQCHSATLLTRIEAHHSTKPCVTINRLSPGHDFTIHHHSGSVTYDASSFVSRNRDTISDDVIWMFSQQNCSFGFGTHLFFQEIGDAATCGPRGQLYKILPRMGSARPCTDSQTLMEDFSLNTSDVMKKLTATRPHFIYCIKSNASCSYLAVQSDEIRRQVQCLHIAPAANTMKTALTHRMRYSLFNDLYRLLLPHTTPPPPPSSSSSSSLPPPPPPPQDKELLCKAILEHLKDISRNFSGGPGGREGRSQDLDWVFRQNHLHYSEQVRQELESYKLHVLYRSAVVIQSQWRGHQCRKRWPFLFQHLQALQLRRVNSLPNEYNPVFVTSSVPRLDWNTVRQICTTYGINPNVRPPLPAGRQYSVAGNVKVNFPQTRIVTQHYKVGKHVWLQKGEEVRVLMPSPTRPGYLTVHLGGLTHHVPHHVVQLRTMGTLL
ncbi:unconventional myosin-VIIa-like isoform X2 [Argonauta hians]